MTEDNSQMGASDRTPPRVSIRFVLCVLIGAYLVGFGMYRINNEPPDEVWLGFRYHNPGLKEYLTPIRHIWQSDDPVTMKAFHTLYAPCYVAEDWIIYRLLW